MGLNYTQYWRILAVLITESKFGNDYVFPGKVRLFAFWYETALP